MSSYTSIQQHEPLRVPSGWTTQERALIAQLEETFDDIYRRFNRLRMEDLSDGLQMVIEDNTEGVASTKTSLALTNAQLALKLDKTEAAVGVNNSAIIIDSNGIQINSEGGINVDGGTVSIKSGSSLTMEAATDEDATINGGAIWHAKNLVVSTAEPNNPKRGLVWIKPNVADADAYYSGSWTAVALGSEQTTQNVSIKCSGTALGSEPSGEYACTYTTKLYINCTGTDGGSAHVYLSSSSGGTDIDCGTQDFSQSGWFESTAVSGTWLGNSSTIFINVVLSGAGMAIAGDKAFSVAASLGSGISGTVNGWTTCSVHYYTGEVLNVNWISPPTQLRVNGSTSSSSSECRLTWTAASIFGVSGITYYIYQNGTQIATTTATSYTISSPNSLSNVTFTVRAYNSALGYSDYTNAVTYTYYVYVEPTPTTSTVYASNSFTKTSAGNDYSTPICANNSSTGYAAYAFNGDSMFDSCSSAYLHFYVERFPATVRISVRSGNDSWVSYNTGLATSVTVSASTGWNTVSIADALSSLSGISSAGVKVYFRSEAMTRISGSSDSNAAYIYLS